MRRWLPHPLLALLFLGLWLLLLGSLSPGAILLGAVLGVAGSGAFAALTPPRARLRRLSVVPSLLFDVLIEIVRSNNAVARIILGMGGTRERRSGFAVIPLDMRSPYGLAALACILTATPGTVLVDHDASRNTMLLHVLDLLDEETWVRIVKDRWERRLMMVFE